MGRFWDGAKKFSGVESVQMAAKGDMKGAIKSNLGSGGIGETLEAVGLKKDKSADEARRKEEAAANAKNQQTGYDLQNQNEKDSGKFFEGQGKRNTDLMGATGKAYGAMDRTSQDLELGQRSLLNEANDQATNAKKVYGGLSGKMDGLVNQSEADAKSAMTLDQYMDPSKSRAFSNVNSMFQDQAQNEGRQGLADVGVLGSLGAQSMGQGMAGMGPLTAGQQMGMLAQSQRQAGAAYANTQNRMQSLRDQGLQQGLNFHDKAYAAGVDAQGRHKGNIQDRAQLTNQDVALQSGLRGERSGFQGSIAGQQDARSGRALGLSQQKYGLDSGLAKDRLGADAALRASRLGLADKELGQNMGKILRADQAADSEVAGNRQMVGQAAAIGGAAFTGGASLAALPAMSGGGGGTAVAPSQFGAVSGGQRQAPGLGIAPMSSAPDYAMAGGVGTPPPQYAGPNRFNLQTRMAG